jgi:hypothetical protein
VHRTGNVVLVSKARWDAMVETAYLSRGVNGRVLRRRIADLEAGRGVQHELVEDRGGVKITWHEDAWEEYLHSQGTDWRILRKSTTSSLTLGAATGGGIGKIT